MIIQVGLANISKFSSISEVTQLVERSAIIYWRNQGLSFNRRESGVSTFSTRCWLEQAKSNRKILNSTHRNITSCSMRLTATQSKASMTSPTSKKQHMQWR
eukprot:Lithocolla_globosa_v1_NODE_878_length_3147_cov_9.319858.p3 type:complete len:101 gc:universal NODE_878_length_3147_cov_9.319858:491-793(+)